MKTLKVHREPLLIKGLYIVPREIRIVLIGLCGFILFYSFIFNTESVLNILNPSQPGDFVGIVLIVFSLALCIRTFQKLTRPYEIIINKIGISCLDWTFTLLPWERIDYVSEDKFINSEENLRVLKIILREPLKKTILPYHHSFIFRLLGWHARGNGSNDRPIIMDMRGLNEDALDVIDFLTENYPKKVQG